MKPTRRQILAGGVASMLGAWLFRSGRFGGIDPAPIPGELSGASATIGHRLRSGGFPPPAETLTKDAVVIGGGIAGLAAGYRLAKAGLSDFTLLDLEDRPGGNARSGANRITAYPWGAHYVPLLTEEAKCVRRLFEELGVITGYDNNGLPVYDEFFVCHDPNERLYRFGRWQDGLIPLLGIGNADKNQYAQFFGMMTELKSKKGKDGRRIFAIPVDLSSQDEEWRKLDSISMAQWLDDNRFNSEPLRWYVEYCCRDDFGTSLSSTSAWAGLHYFAARNGRAANTDADSVITWPEGNGWLAGKLLQPILSNIRANALCYSVQDNRSNVAVDYFDTLSQKSVRIEAKAAILAVPRFVAARLADSSRYSFSAKAFSYSPWAVANISISKLPAGKGAALSWDNVVFDSPLLGYVNAVHQITQMHPTATVLTYYWPLSHLDPTEARLEATARSYRAWQRLFLDELLRVHPELEDHVERVDIWVWGHGMIRPTPGFIWGQERRQALSQMPPIFTAHSDMSGISIFEEAYTHGIRAAEQALQHLDMPFDSEL